MAIKVFILALLITVITLLTASVTFNKIEKIKKVKHPLVTFTNYTMYSINEKETTQIIQSNKALHYKNIDKLYNATIVIRTNIDTNTSITDSIYSKLIEVTPKLFKFRGDVRYNRMNMSELYSESLDYDRTKKKLISNKEFIAIHDGNKLKGGKMVIDKNNTVFTGYNNKPVKIDIILKGKNDETN